MANLPFSQFVLDLTTEANTMAELAGKMSGFAVGQSPTLSMGQPAQPAQRPQAPPPMQQPPQQWGFNAQGVNPAALSALARLQEQAGTQFDVTSAFRDPEHNARVGGAKNSQHTHGNAFDISVKDMPIEQRQELIRQARTAGFGGVGVYDNSLHFDVGGQRAWGPNYHNDSLPDWARDAVGEPVQGGADQRTLTGGGTGDTLGASAGGVDMGLIQQLMSTLPDQSPEAEKKRKAGAIWNAVGVGLGQMSAGNPVDVQGVLQQHIARQNEISQRMAEILMEKQRQAERTQDREWTVQDAATAARLAAEENQLRREHDVNLENLSYGNQLGAIGYEGQLDATQKQEEAAREAAAKEAELNSMKAAVLQANPELGPVVENLTGDEGIKVLSGILGKAGGQTVDATAAKATSDAAARANLENASAVVKQFPSNGDVAAAFKVVQGTNGATSMDEALATAKAATPKPLDPTTAMQEFAYRQTLTPEQQAQFDASKRTGVPVLSAQEQAAVATNKAALDANMATRGKLVETDAAGAATDDAIASVRMALDSGVDLGPKSVLMLPVKQIMADVGFMSADETADLGMQEIMAGVPMRLAQLYRGPGAQSDKDLEAIISATVGLGKTEYANRLLLQGLEATRERTKEKLTAFDDYINSGKGSQLGFEKEWAAREASGDVPQPYYVAEAPDSAATTLMLDAFDKGWLKEGDMVIAVDEATGEKELLPISAAAIAAIKGARN